MTNISDFIKFSSIIRILNQHLQIMQWINTQTAALVSRALDLSLVFQNC